MAISRVIKTSANMADFAWLGGHAILNTSYDNTYNISINEAIAANTGSTQGILIDQLRFNRYLPSNLNTSILEYKLSYIEDVNWANGRAQEEQANPSAPPPHDWNLVSSTLVNQQKIDLSLQQWKYIFDETNVNADITFAYAPIPRQTSGVTYVGADNTATGGGNFSNKYVVFFNTAYALQSQTPNVSDLSIGTWGGWVAMHEMGHVWGLLHTGTTDDLRFSIMSYPSNFASAKIPLTPGMQDIKDLQLLYGTSHAQDGDTTYTFGQGSADLGHGNVLAGVIGANLNKYVMTIWDRPTTTDPVTGKVDTAGGIDTIDASSLATKTYIDLRAGHFSAIGTDINTPLADGDNGSTDYNVGIAKGAEIENAKGGAVDDYIRGNDLANVLEGNGGNDTLQGGVGNDTLDGGSGFDTYMLEGLFKMATIKDNDGQGSITLDSHAIFGASKQILQDIYHDEGPGKKTYIKLSDGGLLVAGAGGEQNIYIQQWNSNNLGISLSGEVAAAPEATPFSTFVGDEKTIISHFKTSKHLPCSPISMRVAEHPLFNLNTQKPAANDNNWRLVA